MSTNFNVNVNGKPVQIKSGEKIDDIKKKFGDKADVIFEGVDVDNNGVLDAEEVDKLKTNLNNNDFTITWIERNRCISCCFFFPNIWWNNCLI